MKTSLQNTNYLKSKIPQRQIKPAQNYQLTWEQLFMHSCKTEDEYKQWLNIVRTKILHHGIPENEESLFSITLRGKIWKILLNVTDISYQQYMIQVELGKSVVYEKIKNDTFRTLATDKKFLQKVKEEKLIRVLNAFANMEQNKEYADLRFSYVQGMNVLLAPFLYVMPELDTFFTFSTFIKEYCPLYVQPALEGVHCGLQLLDKCLRVIDPELYGYLRGKNLTAQVYAFPSVLTFCACTPPLNEVLKLWDFLLAYGIHLNIICVIAQFVIMRDDLLMATSPMKLLRILPELNAKKIVSKTVDLVKLLPDKLYDQLVRHPMDPAVYLELALGGHQSVQKHIDNDRNIV